MTSIDGAVYSNKFHKKSNEFFKKMFLLNEISSNPYFHRNFEEILPLVFELIHSDFSSDNDDSQSSISINYTSQCPIVSFANFQREFPTTFFFSIDEHFSNPMAPANYRPHDDSGSGTGYASFFSTNHPNSFSLF